MYLCIFPFISGEEWEHSTFVFVVVCLFICSLVGLSFCVSLVSKRFVYLLFDKMFAFLSVIFREGRGAGMG